MDFCSPTPIDRKSLGAASSFFIPLSFVVLGLVFWAAAVEAQVPQIPRVSQEGLASHLMTYVAPIYPATAQSAKVQGDIVINVEIGPDGLVRSTKVISGPPMLRSAAQSALKQWRYASFRSGNGSNAVTGNVLVSFTLLPKPVVHTPHESSANGSYTVSVTFPPTDHRGEPDVEIATRFDVPWEPCTRGVIAQATDAGTADACKKAAAIADEFPSDRRFTERSRAYVYAATAYANVRDLQTALHYADKAVEVVNSDMTRTPATRQRTPSVAKSVLFPATWKAVIKICLLPRILAGRDSFLGRLSETCSFMRSC
jgi:TonB family protein